MKTDAPAGRGHLALPFGAFYGSVDRRLRSPGMEIALLNVDPHRVVERHSHHEAHFVYVLDGLYVSSALHAAPVTAGRALIFNPAGTTHRDRFEARDRVMSGQFLTLSLAPELVDAAQHELGGAQRAIALSSTHALALAERLARATLVTGTGDTLQRESLALALLAEVATTRRETASHSAPAWLATARARLDEALGSDIRIAEIARVSGVHPVHLARVFRHHMGMTPADYLRLRRLAHACTLLRETRRPIAEIAHACGFADQSPFATAFRRAYRVTPRVYRRH